VIFVEGEGQVRQGLGEAKMQDLLDNLSEIIALAKEK